MVIGLVNATVTLPRFTTAVDLAVCVVPSLFFRVNPIVDSPAFAEGNLHISIVFIPACPFMVTPLFNNLVLDIPIAQNLSFSK